MDLPDSVFEVSQEGSSSPQMKLIRDHSDEVDIASCLQDRETWETFEGDSVLRCVCISSSGRAKLKISERISGASIVKADGGIGSEISWEGLGSFKSKLF